AIVRRVPGSPGRHRVALYGGGGTRRGPLPVPPLTRQGDGGRRQPDRPVPGRRIAGAGASSVHLGRHGGDPVARTAAQGNGGPARTGASPAPRLTRGPR